MDRDLVSALYGELSDGDRRKLERRLDGDDASRERLDQWEQLRGALGRLGDDAGDPPRQVRDSLMTEAALELRIRETEGLDTTILEADGTRRVVAPTSGTPSSSSGLWGLAPGQWAMLASAAMVLVAVTLAVAFDPLGVVDRRASYETAAEAPGADGTYAQGQLATGMKMDAPGDGDEDTGTDSGGTDTPPDAVTVEVEVQELDRLIPVMALDEWRGKAGIMFAYVLDSARDRVTDADADAGQLQQAVQLAWSVYRHPEADDDAREDALVFLADNGVRLDESAQGLETTRAADALLYKNHRDAWMARQQRLARATPQESDGDAGDDDGPQEQEQQEQQRNNEPPPQQQQQQMPDDGFEPQRNETDPKRERDEQQQEQQEPGQGQGPARGE